MNSKVFLTASIAALAFVVSSATAQDTEIYIGQSDEAVSRNPNVLFIVDTSGSMGTDVEVEQNPYDDSVDYEDVCVSDDDDDRVYWSRAEWDGYNNQWSTEPPACNSSRWIENDAMLIDDVNDSLGSQSGMAISRAARYEQVTEEVCTSWWLGIPGFSCQEWEEQTGWQAEPLQAGNHTEDVDLRPGDNGEEVYGFFTPNYVNWFYTEGNEGDTETMTRMDIVKDIANDLVDSISGVNVGLMRFDRYSAGPGTDADYSGGYVDLAVGDIGQQRTEFKHQINNYEADGSTPLAETLYEAMRYWRGDGVHFGHDTSPGQSTADSRDGEGSYESPIQYACQKNHIVYLTDGEPQYDSEVDEQIEALSGRSCQHTDNTTDDGYSPPGHDNCMDELSAYLYETDLRSDADVPGTNRVITHTVGFFTDQELLKDTAREGHGDYYTADNYGELKTALTTLFTNIISSTSLFTAPAVSVNAFNRLEHLNEVYFALFRPGDRAVWQGNVKRYKIDNGQLVDANSNPAIDENTGQFSKDAQSFWSDVIDGNDVPLGGAVGELPDPGTRDTYTDSDDDADMEALHEDNEDLTPQMLGLDSGEEAYRDKLLRWVRGIDVDDADGDGSSSDNRRWMGDPLHARPELVTYGDSADDPQLTMFVMTNEGYLHAIDTSDGTNNLPGGTELWAYMPESLLPNIAEQYEGRRPGEHTYGLDGPLTSTSDGDEIRLFFGMRRGGRAYHALDVSDRETPQFMWTIESGQAGYEELAQTWSRPIATEINIDGTEQKVLIFAGGYDPDQDSTTTRTTDSEGRAVFIVDPDTGSVLWSGADDDAAGDHETTFSAMDYSIPSDMRVLDVNNDGLADQMYVGDMGGQIWRFDIHNGQQESGLVTGGVIADLATDAEEGNRRFYYAPDIAPINEGGEQWLSLSIGSGFRAHPLYEGIDDRFYMMRIEDVYEAPTDDNDDIAYETVGETDLYDATENHVGQGNNQEVERENLNDAEGWYVRLTNSGEKVMAESVTLAGEVVFTTYQPSDDESASCGPGAGIGRTYAVDVTDATPVEDQDGDGNVTADDRSIQLKRAGIPPAPTVVFLGNEPSVLVGPEMPVPNIGAAGAPERIYWSAE